MKHRLTGRVQGGDDGSALVLALMVVLLVGTLFAAALDYTRTGLLVTPEVRNDRNEVLTIQSAVDGAINNIRGSSLVGKPSTPCPDFVPPLPSNLPGVESTEDFRVTCTPQAPATSTSDGAPTYAIHALGTSPEGIRQVNPSNAELLVTGGIYSKGVISVGGGSQSVMSVTGSAVSEVTGGCTGTLLTTDLAGARCGPIHARADGADPGYGTTIDQTALEALIAAGPATEGADPRPSCSGGVAQFEAGYYGERPDVLLAKTNPACTATVWRFAAGPYYFDYDGVWDLGSKRVVFGSEPSPSSTVLGKACDRGAAGVHLVFGGESRIFTQSSASADNGLEVCGPLDASYYSGSGTPQRIAIYGLTSANSLGASSSKPAASSASSIGGTGGWDVPAKALTTDGTSAAVVLQKNDAATLAWHGFAHAPKGGRVTKAEIELTHQGVNAKSARLELTGPGGLNISEDVSGCAVCTFDVTTQLEARRTDVLWRYLSQLAAVYEVQGKIDHLPVSATASLVDGVRLVVQYDTPALAKQTCSGSGCLFVESTTNANVFIHGTVYTPTAAWSVNVHNAGETIFDRGVVLRDLAVKVSGSTKQTTSPFQLPHTGADGRKVLFRGYVDGVERVRACVRYVDRSPIAGTSDTQAFAGYSLKVTQWLVFAEGSASSPAACPS